MDVSGRDHGKGVAAVEHRVGVGCVAGHSPDEAPTSRCHVDGAHELLEGRVVLCQTRRERQVERTDHCVESIDIDDLVDYGPC